MQNSFKKSIRIFACINKNNHILGENLIKNGKRIHLTINNDKEEKEIKIYKTRKKMTIETDNIDITIIEIKPNKNKINNFLDVEEKY